MGIFRDIASNGSAVSSFFCNVTSTFGAMRVHMGSCEMTVIRDDAALYRMIFMSRCMQSAACLRRGRKQAANKETYIIRLPARTISERCLLYYLMIYRQSVRLFVCGTKDLTVPTAFCLFLADRHV